MKPALSLRVGQQVTMTPQLQQAIRLMQLSSVELAQEVREAIETNPMLDYPDDAESDQDEGAEYGEEADDYQEREAADGSWEEDDSPEADWAQGASEEVSFADSEIPGELPVDTSWDEIYQAAPMAPPSAGTVSAERDREFASGGESLTDYLLWQLNLAPVSARDRVICPALGGSRIH
ncbi:MAG: RNA polymerase factor sigma-54, partial [Gammaproteobacteria bacterium]|nr:RNA polymerase factor sigma-54 [Gammaproteobacteria bacterium]